MCDQEPRSHGAMKPRSGRWLRERVGRRGPRRNSGGALAGLGGLLVLGALAGCARNLTVWQDHYINTAPHANRPPEKRTGEPLELAIVAVYPSDLKKPSNELLRPDSPVTCKDWFERCPVGGRGEASVGGDRFDLPRDQIFLFAKDAKDPKLYGKVIGKALSGAHKDGKEPIRKGGIVYRLGTIHDHDAVLYVFPKFIGRDGGYLPIAPVKFHPPGAYTDDLVVRIGVRENQPIEQAQYIENLTPRKLHGREK